MSDRYNKENTEEKEVAGRQAYLNWLESKPECQHVCFTQERWCSFDSIFLSADTQVICDIKGRNYPASFFNRHGVEVDAQKARDVYNVAKQLSALPIIITCTSDGQHVISDLTLASKFDIFSAWRQNNDNDHQQSWKELINLKNCTIK